MLVNWQTVKTIGWLVAAAMVSWAGPISSCSPNQQQLVTCNLYETDSEGVFTEHPPKVLVGSPVNLGFVVFLEPGIDPNVVANQTNAANWSDLIDFTLSDDQFFVQLLSDPFPADLVQFVLGQNPVFAPESAEDPTVFIGGSGNTYNIFSESAADTDIPEPSVAMMLLAGAALLAGFRLLHHRGFPGRSDSAPSSS